MKTYYLGAQELMSLDSGLVKSLDIDDKKIFTKIISNISIADESNIVQELDYYFVKNLLKKHPDNRSVQKVFQRLEKLYPEIPGFNTELAIGGSVLSPELVSILDKLRKDKFAQITPKDLDLLDQAIGWRIAFGHDIFRNAHSSIGGLTRLGLTQWIEGMKDYLLLRTSQIAPEYFTETEKDYYENLAEIRSKKEERKSQVELDFLRDYGAKFGEMPTRFITYNEDLDEIEISASGETKSDNEEICRVDYTNDGLLDYVRDISVSDKKKLNPRSVEIIQRDIAQSISWSAKQDEQAEPSQKTLTVKVPLSSNLIWNAGMEALGDMSKLSEEDFIKAWKYVLAANYMFRYGIEVSDYKHGKNHHVLHQAGAQEKVDLVNAEFKRRGLEDKYSLFVENKKITTKQLDREKTPEPQLYFPFGKALLDMTVKEIVWAQGALMEQKELESEPLKKEIKLLKEKIKGKGTTYKGLISEKNALKAIINREQNFGTLNGVITKNDEIKKVVNQHLKQGTAKLLVDTEETLMYELGKQKPSLKEKLEELEGKVDYLESLQISLFMESWNALIDYLKEFSVKAGILTEEDIVADDGESFSELTVELSESVFEEAYREHTWDEKLLNVWLEIVTNYQQGEDIKLNPDYSVPLVHSKEARVNLPLPVASFVDFILRQNSTAALIYSGYNTEPIEGMLPAWTIEFESDGPLLSQEDIITAFDNRVKVIVRGPRTHFVLPYKVGPGEAQMARKYFLSLERGLARNQFYQNSEKAKIGYADKLKQLNHLFVKEIDTDWRNTMLYIDVHTSYTKEQLTVFFAEQPKGTEFSVLLFGGDYGFVLNGRPGRLIKREKLSDISELQKVFGGRFVFSKTEDGRFEVSSQEPEGLKQINIRGVKDLKEFKSKLKSWIKSNPDLNQNQYDWQVSPNDDCYELVCDGFKMVHNSPIDIANMILGMKLIVLTEKSPYRKISKEVGDRAIIIAHEFASGNVNTGAFGDREMSAANKGRLEKIIKVVEKVSPELIPEPLPPAKISLEFNIQSEYGETTCVIDDVAAVAERGWCPCGDGNDYRFGDFELHQLREIADSGETQSFIPVSKLKYPLNWISKMKLDGNSLLLPTERMTAKEYADVKNILLKSGGSYKRNSFVFEEPAADVYLRILSGEDYNLKKKFQYFPTPAATADYMVKLADIKCGMSFLEPSAGRGSIINAIHRVCPDAVVDYFEIMETNRKYLEAIPNTRARGVMFEPSRSMTFKDFLKKVNVVEYREPSVPFPLYKLYYNEDLILKGLDITKAEANLDFDVIEFARNNTSGLGLQPEEFKRKVLSLLPNNWSTYNYYQENIANWAELLLYDRIIANPPFSNNQDVNHISLMYEFLSPGGRLVAVSSTHWQFATEKKSKQFREWIEKVGAQIIEVPVGTFKESGTMIPTLIIVIEKP